VSLAAGTRLGPYEILSPLGAGGMGEVYKARDTRLERTVAVKVLPSHMSASAEVRQRFEREAKTISQLSHPHICALYDVGREGETEYLVMELLEGETLSDRLAKGPLPLEQTLRYGQEIADALDKAHRQGIVHRDLKPANVMLTKSGVKLLDFGLAKAMETPTSKGSLTSLPTQQGLTQEGTILGTFQYMAPEQLEGKEADARTDIFALGATLYEMATGKKAFAASSQASLIAAILERDPPSISSVLPTSPPAFDRLVRTCFAKDPEERLQSAHDVAAQLRWIAEGSAAGAPAPAIGAARRSRPELAGWVVAALAVLAALAGIRFSARSRSTPSESLRASLLPPTGTISSGPLAFSPDGGRIAFVAEKSGRRVLYVRALDSLEPRPLPGTENALYPFWSPDGRSLGFFTQTKLKRIDLAGGSPRDLASVADPRGGTWSPEGVIVYGPDPGSGLLRILADGGEAGPVTRLDASRQETSHRWPSFLPDGKHFFYLDRSPLPKDRLRVEVGSIDGKTKVRVLEADSGAVYTRGRIYFMRQTTLMAQPFDLAALRTTGEPSPVAESAWRNPQTDGLTAFSVASDGAIAYRLGGFMTNEPTWFDRGGHVLGTLGTPLSYASPRLSPDGSRVIVDGTEIGEATSSMRLVDAATGSMTRLTFGTWNDTTGDWSPDGTRIVYASDRKGPFDIYVQGTHGGEAAPLVESRYWKYPESWSPDGRYLAYREIDPRTRGDIWILPMGESGSRKAQPFLNSPADERNAAFSPDGRFIAYGSDESGREEVYVQTFPSSGAKWQVSNDGGSAPSWRSDGKELFYATADRRMMAVPIEIHGSSLTSSAPQMLFLSPTPLLSDWGRDFAVSADGQRFLILTSATQETASPITLVTNWTAELKEKK
jgi:eukaryotic-like serine/threonine-protein kinase